jgi:glycosyltransferase involved in cell wall biosynthesis/ubiquinone/menaquinone biosynthesis C-methylase UbiE
VKIAIFHLAFIYSGGGEKLVLEEARGLKERGHKVTIFTPVLDTKKCFPDIIDKFDIKTFVPRLPSIIPQWEIFQILLSSVFAPFLAFRFKNFDAIFAANQPSPWLAFWVRKLFGVPYISYLSQPTRFLHRRKVDEETGLIFGEKRRLSPATYLMKIVRPLADWIDKASIKKSDSVLADGKYMKEILEKTYNLKTTISCPAGAYPINKRLSTPSRRKGVLRINRKTISKPYILLTNRHFPQKRFEYAISALPIVLEKFPNVSMVITGKETDYTRSMKSLVKQLSLEEKVIFLGFVKEKDLEKLYSEASVYCYTAPEEDFGMGMIEAMAYGTPPVAWNNAGPTGIIDNGKTGFLAKPFDIADFANKIIKLLKNEKLAKSIGEQALGKTKKDFSYQNHVNIIEKELYQAAKANYATYPLYSSFTNRKFLHFSYALNALEKVKGKVLDIGCGSGRLTSEIKKTRRELEITGCDKDLEPLDYFEKYFNNGINIVHCDAQKLPFKEKSFNAILMFDVLEHLEKPKNALKEVRRTLKKGGIFHLAVPCEKSLATWDGWLYRFFKINLKHDSVGHIQLFTLEDVRKMLADQQFEVLDFHFSQHFIDQFFSFPYYVFVKVFRRGKHFNLRQKGEDFQPLSFLLKVGAWLANFESTTLRNVKGRTLHITASKKA